MPFFWSESLPDNLFSSLEFAARTSHFVGKRFSDVPFLGSILMIHQGQSTLRNKLGKTLTHFSIKIAIPYFSVGDMHYTYVVYPPYAHPCVKIWSLPLGF